MSDINNRQFRKFAVFCIYMLCRINISLRAFSYLYHIHYTEYRNSICALTSSCRGTEGSRRAWGRTPQRQKLHWWARRLFAHTAPVLGHTAPVLGPAEEGGAGDEADFFTGAAAMDEYHGRDEDGRKGGATGAQHGH